MSEPTTSVNWDGIRYTGYASQGAKFGTGTGATAEEARAAAVKDLEKDPSRTAPEHQATHSTAVAAGQTGAKEQK